MNISALSVTVSWLFATFMVVDASAQVVATNTDCTAITTLDMTTFSFGPPKLKDFTSRTNESEPIFIYKSPMTVSNGVWYYTFVSNDSLRQVWRQSCSEIARDDFGKVGEIGFFGKKFAVTEGPPVVNMNHLPDANRDEMIREKARRVELGDGFFMSEKEKLGYHITKNLAITTKSLTGLEIHGRF